MLYIGFTTIPLYVTDTIPNMCVSVCAGPPSNVSNLSLLGVRLVLRFVLASVSGVTPAFSVV